MALVIAFTFIETNGLTLKQIDKLFNGVPRSEITDVIEAYNGNKPIVGGEVIEGVSTDGGKNTFFQRRVQIGFNVRSHVVNPNVVILR